MNLVLLLVYLPVGCQQGDGEEEAAEFTAQDIDQILEQRTQQRQIGGYVASNFCSTNVLLILSSA